MRVGQEPHVEHHVDAARQAALERKAFHRENHPVSRIRSKKPLDLGAQVVRRHVGRVDQELRRFTHRHQQFHLAPDAHLGRLGRRQRVASTCLRVAPDQHVGATVQVEDLDRHGLVRRQPVDQRHHGVDREIPVADIDTQRQRARVRPPADHPFDQR